MKTSLFRLLAVTAAVTLAPAATQAGWITAGNGVIVTPNSADGVINFGVFEQTTAGEFAASLGSGVSVSQFSGNTTTARFIYAFQVVNSNPGGGAVSTITSLSIQVSDVSAILGFGQLTSTGGGGSTFTELNGTQINPTNNTRLDGLTTDPTAPGSNTNSTAPANTIGVATPTTPTTNALFGGTAVNANNQTVATFLLNLPSGGFSNIVFFTSNLGPTTGPGTLDVIGANGTVSVPTPTPEPGTLALIGLGLPLAGLGYRRLRKPAAETAVSV